VRPAFCRYRPAPLKKGPPLMKRHQSPKGPSQRQLRAGELIRHALVDILQREEFRDPDLHGVHVTISEVRPSPDLRHATIYCAPLGGGQAETLAAALNRASAFLRGRLGREIDMKFTPELHFEPDATFDEAEKMGRLLNDPRVRRDVIGESKGD
jgi:ribosome-binding factor A